ncbi:MAG: TetR/AcrR family transcriptional regulator [Acidimicrobiales bacterium]
MADIQSRSDRKRADRIAHLERVAAKLFAERGFEATGFEEIAMAVDLRGPSLYHYFPSKEDLFLGCVRRSAAEVMTRLERIIEDLDDPVETLRVLFREQVLIEVRDYPEFVPLFLHLFLPVASLQAEVLALRRAHGEIFERAALHALGRSDGLSTQDRVRLEIAFGALAFLPSWYQPGRALSPEALADEMAERLVEVVLSGASVGEHR